MSNKCKSSARKRGRPRLHPWEDWIGRKRGHTVVLARGRDFECMGHSMMIQLRTKAAELGYRVSIMLERDVLILTNEGRV